MCPMVGEVSRVLGGASRTTLAGRGHDMKGGD